MLAFSIDYYGIFFWATQFVELFCTYFSYSELFIKVTLNNRKAWKQAIFPKFVFFLPDLFYVFVIDIFPNICYVKYIQITHNRHKM